MLASEPEVGGFLSLKLCPRSSNLRGLQGGLPFPAQEEGNMLFGAFLIGSQQRPLCGLPVGWSVQDKGEDFLLIPEASPQELNP